MITRHTIVILVLTMGLLWVVHTAKADIYIEQEISSQILAHESVFKGIQRIWTNKSHIRCTTSFGDTTSIVIINIDTKRIVLIPSKNHEYVEIALSNYQRLVKARFGYLETIKSQGAWKQTKQIEKINDWKCTKYVFESKDEQHEIWVTKDLEVKFSTYLELMENLGLDVFVNARKQLTRTIKGLPVLVKAEQNVYGQKIVSFIKLMKVITEPVDSSLFEIPQGYKKLDDEVLPCHSKQGP